MAGTDGAGLFGVRIPESKESHRSPAKRPQDLGDRAEEGRHPFLPDLQLACDICQPIGRRGRAGCFRVSDDWACERFVANVCKAVMDFRRDAIRKLEELRVSSIQDLANRMDGSPNRLNTRIQ